MNKKLTLILISITTLFLLTIAGLGGLYYYLEIYKKSTPEPVKPLVKNIDPLKWGIDSDTDAIVDYVELANGTDPQQAEDLVCKNKALANCEAKIESEVTKENNNVVIIIDASTSMDEKINGASKMQTLKKTLIEVLGTVPEDEYTKIAIEVYGHRVSNNDKKNSCNDIETIYPLGKLNRQQAIEKINSINISGWTPIAKSLIEAGDIIKNGSTIGNSSIILITDGLETCDGNPVNEARNLINSNVVTKIDVIGFDVKGEIKMLQDIAAAGKGDYLSVSDENSLKNNLSNSVKQSLDLSNYYFCLTKMANEYASCIDEVYINAKNFYLNNSPICREDKNSISCSYESGKISVRQGKLRANYSSTYIDKLLNTPVTGN